MLAGSVGLVGAGRGCIVGCCSTARSSAITALNRSFTMAIALLPAVDSDPLIMLIKLSISARSDSLLDGGRQAAFKKT